MSRLQRSVASVSDAIAKDGLELLRSVLEESGFGKSEHLKDYELYAHTDGSEIVFEILLSTDSVEGGAAEGSDEDDMSEEVARYRVAAMEAMEAKFEEAAVKSFGLSSDGAVRRISTLRDKRHTSRDTKKPSRDTKKKSRDTKRGSEVREFEHKAAAAAPRAVGAPRSMHVGRSGKLKISFTRKLRKTAEATHYPQGSYEGIMGEFVDGMKDIVAQRFIPELEKILSGYLE
jgi:hypothetical protein